MKNVVIGKKNVFKIVETTANIFDIFCWGFSKCNVLQSVLMIFSTITAYFRYQGNLNVRYALQ